MTSSISRPLGHSGNIVRGADDIVLSLGLLDGIELEVAGDQLWRVCNRRIASGPGRFLAFIDEKHRRFEVTTVVDYLGRTPYPTLWEALVHVLEEYGDELALERLRTNYEAAVGR